MEIWIWRFGDDDICFFKYALIPLSLHGWSAQDVCRVWNRTSGHRGYSPIGKSLTVSCEPGTAPYMLGTCCQLKTCDQAGQWHWQRNSSWKNYLNFLMRKCPQIENFYFGSVIYKLWKKSDKCGNTCIKQMWLLPRRIYLQKTWWSYHIWFTDLNMWTRWEMVPNILLEYSSGSYVSIAWLPAGCCWCACVHF